MFCKSCASGPGMSLAASAPRREEDKRQLCHLHPSRLKGKWHSCILSSTRRRLPEKLGRCWLEGKRHSCLVRGRNGFQRRGSAWVAEAGHMD